MWFVKKEKSMNMFILCQIKILVIKYPLESIMLIFNKEVEIKDRRRFD